MTAVSNLQDTEAMSYCNVMSVGCVEHACLFMICLIFDTQSMYVDNDDVLELSSREKMIVICLINFLVKITTY